MTNGGDTLADGGGATEMNFYEVLSISKDATANEIKKAYRSLVIKWHPDKHPSDRDKAEDMIRDINNAYETLSNPAKKQAYDEQLAAVERERTGIALQTAGIQPRSAIPKEFMLCPLGNSQKFIRVSGSSLFVHSRDDVKAEFLQFFEKTKFNLYWLPEVNNMCRIRPASTAQVGHAGGLNITFKVEENAKEAELSLTGTQQGNMSNFICVPSPTMVGAFRFECAYHPGYYLAYRAPNHLRVVRKIEDAENTKIDFMLVKYEIMFKYITMEEVLVPTIKDLPKDQNGYVALDRLRHHESVVMYFRNILGTQPWDIEDFEIYFDARWRMFFYSGGKVKLRTPDEMLAHSLRKARRGVDLAQPIAEADIRALEKLHIETIERVLMVLYQDSHSGGAQEVGGANVQYAVDRLTAQKKLLGVVPAIVDKYGCKSLSLRRLVTLDLLLNAIEDKGAISDMKLQARIKLADLFAEKIRTGEELSVSTPDELEHLLTLPFQNNGMDQPMANALARNQELLTTASSEKLIALMQCFKKFAWDLASEVVGKKLLEKIAMERMSQLKRDILIAVAEVPTLREVCMVEAVRASMQKEDFAEVLSKGLAAYISDSTPKDVLGSIVTEMSPFAASFETLHHLAVACGKCHHLARYQLQNIVAAAPMHVKACPDPNIVAEFCFMLAAAFQQLVDRREASVPGAAGVGGPSSAEQQELADLLGML